MPTSRATERAVPGIVAGDHQDPNAGAVAAGDGVGGVGSHGVADADETEVLEVEVVLLGRQRGGRGELGAGDGEDPEPGVGRRLDLRVECGTLSLREGDRDRRSLPGRPWRR